MAVLPPDTLADMRALWEGSPELSAAKIGARLGVTKNVVIGRADRGRWNPRMNPNLIALTTIHQRLDAIHAALDRVLADTRPWIEGRKPVMVSVA